MKSGKCCICYEEVNSPYWYIKHLDNGLSRIYEGHKMCLSLVEIRLSNGESVTYKDEYDRSKL